MLDFEVAIIGAGPAGISAAIYLKRANINCCIIEKDAPGGQLNKTSTIENYPGFTNITGPDLALKMFEQIKNLEIPYKYGNVLNIENKKTKKIITTDVEKITCKAIILAVGRMPRNLGIKGEKDLIGHGVSYCAICDGPLYKNKNVVIVGGGNSALEEAIYLSSICKKVSLIYHGENYKAQQYLIDKLKEQDNVEERKNAEIVSFNEDEKRLKSVTIENINTKEQTTINCDGCFLFIGQTPATQCFKKLGIIDEKGYIEVDENKRTKIPLIYAAGDTIKKELFQIVTATSDGAIAATSYIKDRKLVKK